MIGTDGSPGRRKYACNECTCPCSGSTVRAAATSAWPATCPPNTRCTFTSGLTPRKMLTSIGSRSSSCTRLSTVSWGIGPSWPVTCAAHEQRIPYRVHLGDGHGRAPDRGRQLEQRLVGVRAHTRIGLRRAVGRRLRLVEPLARGCRAVQG